MDAGDWEASVKAAFLPRVPLGIYIHLPFCDSLCTYCGCNKHITKNHKVEDPYIDAVLAEWQQYVRLFPELPLVSELHLGGGTPTFFSPAALERLISGILERAKVTETYDFGFEAHPWSTTKAHLETLHAFGFDRISIGVQDFDEELMKLVNRRQSIESVVRCTELAREVGFSAVNYDLIYGLPRQTPAHIERDAAYIDQLKPERIAFYAYAHVPWLKQSQTAYSEADLPKGAAKRLLYEIGRDRFEAMGYSEIGMDHFALPNDRLAIAMQTGKLHRNFMGYTNSNSQLTIGLGASAIGDTWDAFAQNEKSVADYQARVMAGQLPVFRGHFLSKEDQILRRHILNLMTRYETHWENPEPMLADALIRLEPLISDGLVDVQGRAVRVTSLGRPFLRNICMAFDAHYWRKEPQGKRFSQTV